VRACVVLDDTSASSELEFYFLYVFMNPFQTVFCLAFASPSLNHSLGHDSITMNTDKTVLEVIMLLWVMGPNNEHVISVLELEPTKMLIYSQKSVWHNNPEGHVPYITVKNLNPLYLKYLEYFPL
jgi:hypothetical protein